VQIPRKLRLPGLAAAACAAGIAALAACVAPAAATAPASNRTHSARERELLDSHELWATIDVCSPANERNTVGIRGSMPGDGHSRDRMYMSFRLQYMDASKQWVDLSGAGSSWMAVGDGAIPRQGGTSFELKPVAGKPAVMLRGVVDFQWRHGKTVLQSATAPTTTGHVSLKGADPAGFSAATCTIG